MFKSLVLLADSVSYGKQIIYSLPEHIATQKFLDVTSLPQQFRRNPVFELLNRFLSTYNYCKSISIKLGTLTPKMSMLNMVKRFSLIVFLEVPNTLSYASPSIITSSSERPFYLRRNRVVKVSLTLLI